MKGRKSINASTLGWNSGKKISVRLLVFSKVWKKHNFYKTVEKCWEERTAWYKQKNSLKLKNKLDDIKMELGKK